MKKNKSKQYLIRTALFAILIMFFSIACKKENENEQAFPEQFNKEAMLDNIGQNVILSNYSLLNNSIISLENAFTSYKNNLTQVDLNNLRLSYLNAYRNYQLCSAYEFGPAESASLRVNVNTFPTDTVQIIKNINSASYVLSAAENIDAKGFPAIDYMLYGIVNNDSLILQKYKDPSNGIKLINYLNNVISDIKSKVNTLYQAWNPASGNYITTFKISTGSDVGSSISMLINQLTFDLEIIKNAKLAIPLGKKTLGSHLPEKCEAYYSRVSVELMKKNLNNLYNTYAGIDVNGANKDGFDDYLEFLSIDFNGTKLHLAINNQFNLALNKLNEVPDPLSQSILSQNAKVEAAYIEIQKLVVLLKNDLASALGIQITYQDSDGD
jgi:predicted lipoprotein